MISNYLEQDRLIIAIGNPIVRNQIALWANQNNITLQTFVDSTAVIAFCRVQYGTLISPLTLFQAIPWLAKIT